MPILLRIAFRNMWEHKAKSLIIGILIALGVIVLVLGNAMMDSAAEGVRKNFIENFTGDIMIHGPSKDAVSIFGVESMDMSADTEVPTIPDYERVMEIVRSRPDIAAATGLATAYGLVSVDNEENIDEIDTDSEEAASTLVFGIVFGVDADHYFKLFPSVRLIEGRQLKSGEAAVMLNTRQMERLEKKYKRDFSVGDKVLINGISVSGMRIRETEIVGVYEREESATEQAPFLYTDIDTARVLGGLTLGGAEEITLDETQTAVLGATDLDSLFDDDFGMVDAAPLAGAELNFDSTIDLLGDTALRDSVNQIDSGAWNFILIRLKDSGSPSATAASIIGLTTEFEQAGLDVNVVDWKGAAGSMGSFVEIVRMVFYIALIIISIVAVIIMMNTLVVSVIERTSEIGTMRALGAQRSFVRAMFLTETLTLTVVFGLIGSLITIAAVTIVNALKIPADGAFIKLLFGGEIVHITPSLSSFVSTIFMVFVVGFVAHLYPVTVALKIQPVKAMQAE